MAGAVGLRLNSPEQIRQVKEADLGLPIIGLYKVWHDDTDVFITPTMKEVDAIVEAGADISHWIAHHKSRMKNYRLGFITTSSKEISKSFDLCGLFQYRRSYTCFSKWC